jgi:hypothetical protein
MEDRTAPPWRAALGAQRLIVTGFGRWGGGVYDLTDGTPVALDDMATAGAAIGGERLWRLLRSPGEQTGTCELLSYDARGVRSYDRLDQIRDPHDVCWYDGAPHITTSWDDAIWRLRSDGPPERVWQGSTVTDGWHVNSLVVVDGALHLCAFGRYDRHRAWKAGLTEQGGPPAGFVHDLSAGRDRLTGLAHPHTPRHHDGRWYVCESARGELTELDPAGQVLRRVPVRRFTRGLAIIGDWALVGGNAHRRRHSDRAEIVVVDLASFEVVARLPMPCLEVYDILAVPPPLARGLATGFGANPARAVDQHRRAARPAQRRSTPDAAAVRLVPERVASRLAAMARPFSDVAARLVGVRADLPDRAAMGTALSVTVEVLNRSSRLIGSVPPRPVRLGARWIPLDDDAAAGTDGPEAATDAAPVRNPLVPLPRVVHPGTRARIEVPLEVPDRAGRYELRVALRHPTAGWFGVRAQAEVTVEPAAARPGSPASSAERGAPTPGG